MSDKDNKTSKTLTNFERLGLVISVAVIGVTLLSIAYLTTVQKNTLFSTFNLQNKSSLSFNSSLQISFDQETKNLIESCTSSENVKNFVPDQYYIDKFKDNTDKVEVATQAVYKLNQRINENNKLEEGKKDKALKVENYDFWLGILNMNVYNRDRLELSKLMETKVSEAKTMSYKTFVIRYYCGQLQAFKILNEKNRYVYVSGYLEFKQNQLNDLQGLNDDDFEKRVYTQTLNNFDPEINYRKAFDQYMKIVNL